MNFENIIANIIISSVATDGLVHVCMEICQYNENNIWVHIMLLLYVWLILTMQGPNDSGQTWQIPWLLIP